MARRHCAHKPTAVTQIDDLHGGEFTGPDYEHWWLQAPCEYGRCTELLCPVCGGAQGGWGPLECPCQDWRPRRDQRAAVGPCPVKPSVLNRTRRRHRRRTRR
jgi:hypothetical protein